jgi:hypothetical protein
MAVSEQMIRFSSESSPEWLWYRFDALPGLPCRRNVGNASHRVAIPFVGQLAKLVNRDKKGALSSALL